MRRDEVKKILSSEKAYTVIKNNILNHKLAPGTRLTSRSMAKLTGVSIIPVLHAFQRLDSEGLIETIPGMGAKVITLDTETIRDKYYLREAIECQVVRILAENITVAQREELLQFTKKLDEFGSSYPVSDKYWTADYEFHHMLARMAGSKTLLKEIKKINLFRFLHRAREWVLVQKKAFSKDHHMQVVDAILSQDADYAEKVMRDHINDKSHSISKERQTSKANGTSRLGKNNRKRPKLGDTE
jgi:DNA-binding GntR family transcriptional regulator